MRALHASAYASHFPCDMFFSFHPIYPCPPPSSPHTTHSTTAKKIFFSISTMKSAQQAQPKKQLSAMIQQPYIVYRGGERGTHHSGGEEPLDESRGEEVRAGLTPWSLELRATMTDDGVGVGGVGGGRRGWRPTRGRPWRGGPCRSRRWRATAAALAGGRRWIRRRRLQQIGGRGGVRCGAAPYMYRA